MTDTAENRSSQGSEQTFLERLRTALSSVREDEDQGGLFQILWIALLVLALFFMSIRFADAREPAPKAPAKVLISFSGASLVVEETVPVQDGRASILLPGTATDLVIRAREARVADRHEITLPAAAGGARSAVIRKAFEERTALAGRQLFLEQMIAAARLPQAALSSTAGSVAGGMSEDKLQAMCLELARTKARIAELDAGAKLIPAEAPGKGQTTWKLVQLRFAEAKDLASVTLSYTYRLPDVRWQPLYFADVTPGDNARGAIHMRLEAEITQPAGFDWPDAELVLVAQGADLATLPPLHPWIIGDAPALVRKGANSAMHARVAAAPMTLEAGPAFGMDNAVADLDPAASNVQWTPLLKGLSQGTSRLLLAERTWDERLVWMARPQSRDNAVYLCAEHVLEGQEKAWPQGSMVLSVDGSVAARGHFARTDGKLLLSFGRDARVHLESKAEPRRTGREGFISQKKVWDWEWQYSVHNERPHTVFVRVECPLPQTVAEDFEASISSTPKADRDDKTLYWEFEIAPDKSRELTHSVRVTGPEKTTITPLAP